jgi:thiol-disulfide isomerase/thioredoxin
MLEKEVAPAIAFVKDAQKELSTDIQFIEGYEHVSTLEQLVKPFRGKILFIDLWATWCAPCLEEFSHKDSLYKFIDNNNSIVILYLSRDKLLHKDRWINAIKHYKLKGYHAIASDSLAKDIWMNINNTSAGELPHYLLVNAEGELFEKNAPKPSQYQALQKSLRQAIDIRGFVDRDQNISDKPTPFENEQIIIKWQKVNENNNLVIKGSIIDKGKNTGQPLWGMNITLVGQKIGTVTSKEGNFYIKVPVNKGKLRFEFTNYKTVELDF